MKKLLIALTLVFSLLFSVNCFAVDWQSANQVTVAWDGWTSPNSGDAVEYNVYLKIAAIGAVEENIGTTAQTQHTITFTNEGFWYVGVQTVRKVDVNGDGVWDSTDLDPDGNPVIEQSTITWSNSTDLVAVPVPFGLRYFNIPSSPINLRPNL